MGVKTFENYAILANSKLSYTEKAGRYAIQEQSEQLIFPDVIKKLELKATDSFLEIGCGLGNLLLPVSFLSGSVTGIDHPDVLDRLRERIPFHPARLIGGNFLELEVNDKFDKILVYSVLHCLADMSEVRQFIEKAAGLLSGGGRLLLGDIPNLDRKKRFLHSEEGRLFQEEWERQLQKSKKGEQQPDLTIEEDHELVSFDDKAVIEIISFIRGLGLSSWLLPQPPDLPFGRTREDILVVREYI